MNKFEKEQLIARLAAQFPDEATAGVRSWLNAHLGSPQDSLAASGMNRGSAESTHSAMSRLVELGATRFGVRVGNDSPQIAACDLAPPLARMIDHTALKADTSEAQIRTLCTEAARYCFASVCVNPSYVALAASLLSGSAVAICTVIGFPLGASSPLVKAAEAEQAIRDGATEIDMVLNVGLLKSRRYEAVEADIAGVVRSARTFGTANRVLVKVILETALLTDEEKVIACVLARNAKADFVKTSTGFSTGGATLEDVALMRRVVGSEMGVKASGGVRSREDAEAMIAQGATRIGASASVAIMDAASPGDEGANVTKSNRAAGGGY